MLRSSFGLLALAYCIITPPSPALSSSSRPVMPPRLHRLPHSSTAAASLSASPSTAAAALSFKFFSSSSSSMVDSVFLFPVICRCEPNCSTCPHPTTCSISDASAARSRNVALSWSFRRRAPTFLTMSCSLSLGDTHAHIHSLVNLLHSLD